MKMQFAVGIGRNERIYEIGDHARVAEESGFASVTLVDSQNTCRDVYPMMTLAAINTRRIRIGHGVTIPFTRHPTVTANATATIDELSGGRVFLGIGAGGVALRVMAMRPRSAGWFRTEVEFIKRFMSGEEVEWNGVKVHSEWVQRPVPVYMSASGPKSLQLAGEIADGVIFPSNANPTVVKWRMEQIEKGAAKVGRDPSKIDVWVRGMIYVTDSKEQAYREVSGYANNAARGLYSQLGQENLNPDFADLRQRLEHDYPGLLEECGRVHAAWDEYQIETVDTPSAKEVTQRIIDGTQLCGTPEEICEKIERLGKLGVPTIGTVTYSIFDKKGMMREIGDRIMPHFRN